MKKIFKSYLLTQWLFLGLFIENLMAKNGLIKTVDLYDITHIDGAENNPGLKQAFWFARANDILTWPTLATSPTTADEKMKYTGNFTMKSGKRFYKGYMTWNEGGLIWSVQGPMDCKSYKHTLEIFRPGADAEAMALLATIKNDNLVFIVEDRDDVKRVLGTEGISAKLDTSEGGTGKSAEDKKGDTMTFVSEGKTPPYIYAGAIPVTAASGS